MDTTSPDPLRKRGRKSAAALTVVAPDIAQQRPEPPARLTREEKLLWRDITSKVKPGWFYASETLLELYVTTLTHQRQIQGFIQAVPAGGERYIELVRLHRTVALAAGNLATKLRLTPRSTVDRYTPKIVPAGPHPWPWEDQCS